MWAVENQGIDQVACGANHSGAVSKQGKVFTWGNGANSRLGNGLTDEQEVPQLVPGKHAAAPPNPRLATTRSASQPYRL